MTMTPAKIAAILDDDPALTVGEVALRLGVIPATVSRWCKSGKLPSFKTLGGHHRIRLSEVTKILNGPHGG